MAARTADNRSQTRITSHQFHDGVAVGFSPRRLKSADRNTVSGHALTYFVYDLPPSEIIQVNVAIQAYVQGFAPQRKIGLRPNQALDEELEVDMVVG